MVLASTLSNHKNSFTQQTVTTTEKVNTVGVGASVVVVVVKPATVRHAPMYGTRKVLGALHAVLLSAQTPAPIVPGRSHLHSFGAEHPPLNILAI